MNYDKHLRQFILVFFDDNLIYSGSWGEHLQHLTVTFSILRDNQLFLKKEHVALVKGKYPIWGTSAGQVSMDMDKLVAVHQWPLPKKLKSLRDFQGLTGF